MPSKDVVDLWATDLGSSPTRKMKRPVPVANKKRLLYASFRRAKKLQELAPKLSFTLFCQDWQCKGQHCLAVQKSSKSSPGSLPCLMGQGMS